jgi:hypothetical protein
MMILELSRMRCDKKDRIKDFNQRFINHLNRIPEKPAKSIQVEFYTAALPPSVAMFGKARQKITLAENFIEALQVEKDIASIASSQGNEENKPSLSEKPIEKKGILKIDTEKNDQEPTDMASMQRVLKQITNELIDLKKNKGEGKKPFKPFMKKRIDSTPPIPPTLGINIEDYAMDNFCRTHHVNDSERTCLELINSFTAMLTPSEPPKKSKKCDKEEEDE